MQLLYLLKQPMLFYCFYNNIAKLRRWINPKKELLSVNADAASSNLPLIRIRMINLIRVTRLNICKFLTICNIILLAAYSSSPWNMNLFCDKKELLSHYKNYYFRYSCLNSQKTRSQSIYHGHPVLLDVLQYAS